MSEVKDFNWQANMSRVASGFKNNPFFKEPVLSPALSIGESFPKEVLEKMQMGATEQPTPTDPWMSRGK